MKIKYNEEGGLTKAIDIPGEIVEHISSFLGDCPRSLKTFLTLCKLDGVEWKTLYKRCVRFPVAVKLKGKKVINLSKEGGHYDLEEVLKCKRNYFTSIKFENYGVINLDDVLRMVSIMLVSKNLSSLVLRNVSSQYTLSKGFYNKICLDYRDFIYLDTEDDEWIFNVYNVFKFLVNLKSLFIDKCEISKIEQKLIMKNCKNLKRLHLKLVRIYDYNFELFTDKRLELEEFQISGDLDESVDKGSILLNAFDNIKNISSIRLLASSPVDIDRFSVGFLKLKHLFLRDFSIKAEVLRELLTTCKCLKTLTLFYCKDNSFFIGSQQLAITKLGVLGSDITNNSVKTIVQNCPNLKDLRLINCRKLTSGWIQDLIENSKELKYLEFSFDEKSYSVSDVGLILKAFPGIERFNLLIEEDMPEDVLTACLAYREPYPALRMFKLE